MLDSKWATNKRGEVRRYDRIYYGNRKAIVLDTGPYGWGSITLRFEDDGSEVAIPVTLFDKTMLAQEAAPSC